MSKSKLIKIIVVLTLLSGLAGIHSVSAVGDDLRGDDPAVQPTDAVGSYILNGEFHWIIPGGEIEIVNFSGLTPEEIFEQIRMSPGDEAEIVQRIPPCEKVIVDGVIYKSTDINKFDGQQLGFMEGVDGNLYAFTTEEGFQQFKSTQLGLINSNTNGVISSIDPVYTHYYYDWYCGGNVINCDYRISLANMPPGWDDAISSLEVATSCYATRLYDYVNFTGNYFEALAGTTYNVLWFQGWNDRASSTLHY